MRLPAWAALCASPLLVYQREYGLVHIVHTSTNTSPSSRYFEARQIMDLDPNGPVFVGSRTALKPKAPPRWAVWFRAAWAGTVTGHSPSAVRESHGRSAPQVLSPRGAERDSLERVTVRSAWSSSSSENPPESYEVVRAGREWG
jgi:hypothetical protein